MVRVKRIAYLYRALALVVALANCSGCATAMNQFDYWNRDKQNNLSPVGDVWWVYGGATTDIFNIQRDVGGKYPGLWIYDLPLSTAADTLLLPVTIIQQIVGRPDNEDEETDPTDD